MNPAVTDISTLRNVEGGETYIARLIIKIQKALTDLGCYDVTESNSLYEDADIMNQIESMSIFIHESMSIGSRNYHSVQHVFDILSSSSNETFKNDPIAILAGIFHDCIYYNIDGGFTKSQAYKLQGAYVEEIPEKINGVIGVAKLRIHPESLNDSLLGMVLQIYGFEPGQELNPLGGQNEYLSAVIAVRELAPLLSPPILAQIATCIEATIPFRSKHPVTGELPPERLYRNLIEANDKFGLQLNNDDIIIAIERAVLLTNEDVANFATDDQGWFLDNTWSLLPESNEALRHSFLYTAQQFQFAVFKMYGFFSFLQPNTVFQRFHNVPTLEEFELRTERAKQNLMIGKKYIAAKLVSTTVLSAIAELTGGDAPISMFMGDLPTRKRISKRLDDSLGIDPNNRCRHKNNNNGNNHDHGDSDHHEEVLISSPNSIMNTVIMKDTVCPSHCNPIVYYLLTQGRNRESSFDVKQSPLAAYFYYYLGDDEMENILKKIKVYPMTIDIAKELLLLLPPYTVKYVAEKVSVLAVSRTNRIKQLMIDLYDT